MGGGRRKRPLTGAEFTPLLYQTDFSRKSSGKCAVLICKIAENNYRQIPEQIVKKQSEHTLYGLGEPVNSLDYLLV